MNKAYFDLARKLLEFTIKKLIAKHAGLAFLSGPVGSIIAIVLSPIVAELLSSGVLFLDFKKIEFDVEKDGEEFKDFFTELQKFDPSKATQEEIDAKILKAKQLTKRHLSAKKFLKQPLR